MTDCERAGVPRCHHVLSRLLHAKPCFHCNLFPQPNLGCGQATVPQYRLSLFRLRNAAQFVPQRLLQKCQHLGMASLGCELQGRKLQPISMKCPHVKQHGCMSEQSSDDTDMASFGCTMQRSVGEAFDVLTSTLAP